jgi:hypothetical protein
MAKAAKLISVEDLIPTNAYYHQSSIGTTEHLDFLSIFHLPDARIAHYLDSFIRERRTESILQPRTFSRDYARYLKMVFFWGLIRGAILVQPGANH